MDHRRCYNSIILKAQRENRSKISGGQYFEKHHIIPDFMFFNRTRKGPTGTLEGNPQAKENLVLLTAREHILSHILLCKIYRNTHYEYSCLCSLLLMSGKTKKQTRLFIHRSEVLNVLRKTNFFASLIEEGKKIISRERKDKIVCKDVITGKIVGSIHRSHPKVVSGEWVHHTKGITLSKSHRNKIQIHSTGLTNGNSKGYTDEIIEASYLNCCQCMGWNVGRILWLRFCKKHNKPYLTTFKNFRFNGQGISYLRNSAEKKLGFRFNAKFYIQKDKQKIYKEALKKWL